MPTYRYFCVECGEFERWRSIHAEPLETHECGNTVARVYTPPALYAIGVKGTDTRRHDAKEDQWTTDMDAYMRLRRDGVQPRQIDGSRDLERDARSLFEIQSGLLGLPEDRVTESYDMARDAGMPI